MTRSCRSVLRLVSWYQITESVRTHILILYWTGDALLHCNYTQHATSLRRPLLSEFQALINMDIAWIYSRWYGVGFLELWCASLLVPALRRLSVHIQRVVVCKLSFVLHQISISAADYPLLATPPPHILYPRSIEQECVLFFFSFTRQMLSLMRSQIGWLVGGVAQYPRSGIAWHPWIYPDIAIGQIAGISSTEFGLASMILAGVSVGTVRDIYWATWIFILTWNKNGAFEITGVSLQEMSLRLSSSSSCRAKLLASLVACW